MFNESKKIYVMKNITTLSSKNKTKIFSALLVGSLFLLSATINAQNNVLMQKSKTASLQSIDAAYQQGSQSGQVQKPNIAETNSLNNGESNPASSDVKELPLGRKSLVGKNWEKGGIFDGYTPEEESLEYRTGISKTFRNPDGTQTAVFAGVVHYKDEKGAWQDVNYSVGLNNTNEFASCKYSNTNAEIKTFFPEMSGSQGVMMSYNGNAFSWWNNPKMSLVNPNGETSIFTANQSAGQLADNKITYPETFPGINDEFVVLENGIGLENNIII
jgi:hypothetical protein